MRLALTTRGYAGSILQIAGVTFFAGRGAKTVMTVKELNESEKEVLFRSHKPVRIDDEFRRRNSSFVIQGSVRMSNGKYMTDDELDVFYNRAFSEKLP
jgi:hypothetical protein